MSQYRLLEEVITKLEKAKIAYMLTGSMVSSLQGVPRSTHDIDLIISISEKDIQKIINSFSKDDYYYNEATIVVAVKQKDQFNLISQKYADKIDFWLLTDSDFDKSRFLRRQKIRFLDLEIYVTAPEDTILEKLYWSKLSGGSKKHYTDALRVYELQMEILDMDYLEKWSDVLEVKQFLRKIQKEIKDSGIDQ